MSVSSPAPKKKLPKWFWVAGIGAAVLIGLYLRNKSANASSQAASQPAPTDVTSNPYYYTNGGAYPDLSQIDPNLYNQLSNGINGATGLPSGFDPTSFEEGITYAQDQLGLGVLGTANVPSTVGNSTGTPGSISTPTRPKHGHHPGKPHHSARRHTPTHHASSHQTTHRKHR